MSALIENKVARHYGLETYERKWLVFWDAAAQKLGIKAGYKVVVLGARPDYRKLLSLCRRGSFATKVGRADLHSPIRLEARHAGEELKSLRKRIGDTGVLWGVVAEEASGVKTDITEDVIREVFLPLASWISKFARRRTCPD